MDRRGGLLIVALPLAAVLALVGCKKDEVAPPPGDDRLWVHTDSTLNRDEAWGIDLTDDGDLVVAQHRANPAQLDVYLQRFSPDGSLVWETRWGDVLDEQVRVLQVEGGLAHVGGRGSLATDIERTEAMVLQVDLADGAVVEVARDNSSQTLDSIDGLAVIDGRVFGSGQAGTDALVLEFDGDEVVQRLEWGAPEDLEVAAGDLVELDGQLVFAGQAGSLSDPDGRDGVLVALEPSDLSELWTTSFGATSVEEGLSGLTTDGTALYAVGIAADPLGNLGDDLQLLAADADGTVIWDTRLPGTASGRAIRVDPFDGNLVVAATLDDDIWLLRVDAATGDVLEETTWGTPRPDAPYDLVIDGDHAIVVGRTQTTVENKDDAVVLSFGLRPFELPESVSLPQLEHHRIPTNGVTLHVVQAGPTDGPVALLLHGFPECWWGWHAQIGPLVELGYRVVVPDQRGYNTSDKPRGSWPYRIDVLADDLLGVLDAVGARRATVVGHDWGGAVGWWLAARDPQRVRRFVAMNIPHPVAMQQTLARSSVQRRRSWYFAAFQIPWFPEWELARDDHARLLRVMFANTATKPFTDHDLTQYRDSWSQPGCVRGMLAWYRALKWQPLSGLDDPRVHPPTLLIWGRQDTALGEGMVEPSLALCDDGRAAFVDGGAHFVQHDCPDQVNALLTAFVGAARHDPAR